MTPTLILIQKKYIYDFILLLPEEYNNILVGEDRIFVFYFCV